MDFKTYQSMALETDQVPSGASEEPVGGINRSLLVPLLGLAGESGQLLSEYKKYLRDGPSHRLFRERVSEELGDLLWYIANVASKADLALDGIATSNLAKVRSRWVGAREVTIADFDASFPDHEQLPRKCTLRIREAVRDDRLVMSADIDGISLGDPLTDNARTADGYRFHDVFHASYAAVLGWSPVLRANMKRKRKSDKHMDEVEDGGRAAVIEEGVSALVFSYARDHSWLEGVSAVDYSLLRTVQGMTSHLEVSGRGVGDWESAILQGYAVFRQVMQHSGGLVHLDRANRRIDYVGPA
jgi:NTP pyrophosphatase (non-canonical NTP hydrolase)